MKKYAVLLVCTALAVWGLFGIKVLTREKPQAVRTVTVTPQTVQRTVECTGRIEVAESEEVFAQLPCVAGTVYVTVGQRVEKGDPLFSVDADATQAVLSQLGAAIPDGFEAQAQTITAPTAGIVTQLNVQQGQLTDHTTPCAVIAPGEEVCVTVAIREKHLRDVKVGQTVMVSGVGFDRELYNGTLTAIADTAHQQYIGSVSETVVDAVVTLDVGQSDASLRVGLGAVADVIVETVENGLLIPYDCIAQDEKGEEYVYLYAENGVAYRRSISPEREYEHGALVVSGISAGDRLVCDPDRLAGEAVRVYEGE